MEDLQEEQSQHEDRREQSSSETHIEPGEQLRESRIGKKIVSVGGA